MRNVYDLLLSENVNQQNNRTAIVYGHQTRTYAELDDDSNNYTGMLKEINVPYGFVGILIDNKIEHINALLSVLKTGKVLVPLYSEYPVDRIKLMIEIIGLRYIFVDQSNIERYSSLFSNLSYKKSIPYRKDVYLLVLHEDRNLPAIQEEAAYVHFTSGTTGVPKAVLGSVIGLEHYIRWLVNTFEINHTSCVSQFSIPGFDPFLKEIIGTLHGGGSIYVPESQAVVKDAFLLKQWLNTYKISVIHCVPSLFRHLCGNQIEASDFENLRYIGLAGEKVNPADLSVWFQVFDERVKLLNCYGPTETTMSKLYYEVRMDDVGRSHIPVGKPMDGVEVIILDELNNRCDLLMVGEVCIKTKYRSFGYVNNAELTAEKFTNDPGSMSEELIYRTGDLGKRMLDGNVNLIGRVDRQVKILGYRIELEEIEGVLLQSGYVKEVAVIAKELHDQPDQLVAYIVHRDISQNGSETNSTIKEHAIQMLPAYMVPTRIINLNELPRNERGKVDYKALQLLKLESQEELQQPRSQEEQLIYDLWVGIVGVEGLAVDKDFLEVGGNSLSIMTLKSRLTAAFDVEITLGEIFNNRTIELQAQLISQRRNEQQIPVECLKDEKPKISKAPLLKEYELSLDQQRIWLLTKLEGESTYNIPMSISITGMFDINLAERAVNRIIERHAILRTAFVERDGIPKQIIRDSVLFRFGYRDLTSIVKQEQTIVLETLLREDNTIAFRIADAELVRGIVFKLGENEYRVYLNIFHIAFDGWSVGLFVKEFAYLYDCFRVGHPEGLNDLAYQYYDYVYWQKDQLALGKYESRRQYWILQLAEPIINRTSEIVIHNADSSIEGGMVNFDLLAELAREIRHLASRCECSLFMVLLTAYFLLIYEATFESDIIIGVPFSGRGREEFESNIGFFVNTLPIRINIEHHSTFIELIEAVRDRCVYAYENDYPINQLVKELNPVRHAGTNAFYSTVFNFHNTPLHLEIPDLEIEIADYFINQAKFDYKIDMQEIKGNLSGRIEYRKGKFSESDIRKLIDSFKRILNVMTNYPNANVTSMFESLNRDVFQIGYGLERLD